MQIPLFEKQNICKICKDLVIYNYFGSPENYYHHDCYEKQQKQLKGNK